MSPSARVLKPFDEAGAEENKPKQLATHLHIKITGGAVKSLGWSNIFLKRLQDFFD